jgi:hypothetical protein
MSDPSGSGFGKFVPGFEFLQNLAGQAAGGVAQGLGKGLPQMPNLGNWVAPTFNVEDLEKRIEELKAVHFWLDQNAKALGATIQALEVQKMTLATLQTMNFSLGDVANALKLKASDSIANFTGMKPGSAPVHTSFAGLEIPPRTYGAAAEDEDAEADGSDGDDVGDGPVPPPAARERKSPAARQAPAASPPAGGVVDPMHWWGALSQQFQTIATNAMKDAAKQTSLDTTRHVASGLTEQAVRTATGVAGKVTRGVTGTVARNVGVAAGMGKAAARAVTSRRPAAVPAAKPVSRKKTAPRRPASTRAPAAPQALPTGDWPLPTAFFQVPGFPMTAPADKKRPAPRKEAAPKKAAAKKAPARKSTARKPATKKTTSARSRR